jgi:putative ABC transport system ATP-binding protein
VPLPIRRRRPCGSLEGDTDERLTMATILLRPSTGRTIPAPTAAAAVDVTRRFGSGPTAVDALRGISLELPEGRFAAIMGPSGSGKSTLMHLMAGLDRPTSGEIRIGETSIGSLRDRELTLLRRRHVGFVFQFFNLLPTLTAEENVTLPLSLGGEKPDRAWLDELFARMDLGDRRRHRPSELSGGEQQRVAIARALVTRPTIVFADEPTGNLDSARGDEVLHLLRDAAERDGQTILMVTHDARAAAVADRVLFFADGRLVAELERPSREQIVEAMLRLDER